MDWLQLPSVEHRQTLPDDPPNIDGGGTEALTTGIVGAHDPLATAPGGTTTALDGDVVHGVVFTPATAQVEVVVEHALGFRFLLRLATPQWTELCLRKGGRGWKHFTCMACKHHLLGSPLS